MTLPFPQDDHSAFDYVAINGAYFVCAEMPEAEKGRKLDSKSAAGSDGGRIVDKGYELSKVTITISLWLREHFDLWNEIRADVAPRPGRTRSAVAVIHPVLADLNIEDVVIEKLGGLKHKGKGLFTITITAIEYHPATPSPARTPTQTDAGFAQRNAYDRGAPAATLGTPNPATPTSPRTTNARP